MMRLVIKVLLCLMAQLRFRVGGDKQRGEEERRTMLFTPLLGNSIENMRDGAALLVC